MAASGELPSIVEEWRDKSFKMSSESNDSIVSLLARGFETTAVVLNKKSDLNKIQRALSILEYDRSLSLQFDKIKNDDVRSLVHGHIETLHFILSELTNERNQVKECGEMFTQTDQELSELSLIHEIPSDLMKESAEVCTQTEKEPSQPSLVIPLHSNDSSHNDFDYPHEEPPNWLEVPKEELFDEISIKNEDIWGDEMGIKDNEMLNDNVDIHNADGDVVGDKGDIPRSVDKDGIAQSEMSLLEYMGVEFENEDVDETMNNSNDNETMGEEGEKDSSVTVEVKKRRSSRNRPLNFADAESLNYSDEDSEPFMKKPKKESLKMNNKNFSDVEKKRAAGSNGNSRKIKCTECEFQTTSAKSFTVHLKKKHSTDLFLAGLALRCDCGVVARSYWHSEKCDIANYTVVQVRHGPIKTFNDEKTTPQCLLCDAYPSTAEGYTMHLHRRHSSTLSAHGVWLLCECGAKYRYNKADSEHTKECTRREFSLHKFAD